MIGSIVEQNNHPHETLLEALLHFAEQELATATK